MPSRLRLSVIMFVLSVGLFAAAISSELGMFRDVNRCKQKAHAQDWPRLSCVLQCNAVHGESRSDLSSFKS